MKGSWRRVLGPTVAALLLVAACAGDDEERAGTGPPTSHPTSTPTMALEPPGGQEALDALRARSGAPGALVLLRRDGAEWFGTSGTADLTGTPITATTRFRVGSITKAVTAALALDAVERGQLALDDPVEPLLPGLLAGPSVTLRMLLAHTSGIFNAGDEGDVVADVARLDDPDLRAEAEALGARYLAGEDVTVSDRIWVALAETHDRYGTPGTVHHYSNVGYQVAGMVIAAATSRTLGDLLAERVAAPLRLEHTTLAPDDPNGPDLRGYTIAGDGTLQDTTSDLLALGNGASGGVVSTAGELLTILQAIVDGRLVDQPLLGAMLSPTPESHGTYGLGMVSYRLACGPYLGHGGAIAGTLALALVSVDGAEGVVLAVNARSDTDPDLLATAEALLCAG